MKILVIDSETRACDLLVRTLKSYFPEHEWLNATSYEEGLAIAQNTSGLDLVFADLKTNEAGGPSLANLIEGMYPNVATYYLGNHGVETTFFRARPGRVFSKPVNIREVVAAIQLAEESIALATAQSDRAGAPAPRRPDELEKLNRMITGEGFTGQVAQFQLHEIIQLCCLGRRTGSMSVSKGAQCGAIYFYEGEVVHAVCDELEGEAAVERIVAWKAGQFTIVDGIIAEKQTIKTDWNFLMLESMRKQDEQAAEGVQTDAEVKVGNSLGPYHLSREISKSETEEHYLANLHSTGLELDLCVLPPARHSDPVEVKRFVAEATTKSDLADPAFLRVTKAVQTEGVYYYTMERVEGSTLESYQVSNRRLTENLAVELLTVVGRAMTELSSLQPTHRPLTHRDIIIDSKDGIRIANLASLRVTERANIRLQLSELAAAVENALQPAPIRSDRLRSVLRRMEGLGLDRIQSWQGLLKAAEACAIAMKGAGEQPAPFDEVDYEVNLVPEGSVFNLTKLGVAAGVLLLLVGSFVLAGIRPGHVDARESVDSVSSFDDAAVTNRSPNLPEVLTHEVESPQVFRSLTDAVQADRQDTIRSADGSSDAAEVD